MGPAAIGTLHAARQRLMERRPELRGWAGVALYNRWYAMISCNLVLVLFDAAQAMRGVLDRPSPAWPADTLEVSMVSAVLPFTAVHACDMRGALPGGLRP